MASTNLTNDQFIRPLQGRLAIITGASRGIGAAIARNLAAKGATLLLCYTSDSSTAKTRDLAKTLENEYAITALTVQADLSTPAGPAHIVAFAKQSFSLEDPDAFRIDILINNAAMLVNIPIEETQVDIFNKMYATNVLGPLLLVKEVMPYLPKDRSGRIVSVSSISSSVGLAHQALYGGTKAALEAMSRTWSRELAERATCNCVNPGPVETDMFAGVSDDFFESMRPWFNVGPLLAGREDLDGKEAAERAKRQGGRLAKDWEIAGVVGMLCSQESGWCTGSVICANGGVRMST